MVEEKASDRSRAGKKVIEVRGGYGCRRASPRDRRSAVSTRHVRQVGHL